MEPILVLELSVPMVTVETEELIVPPEAVRVVVAGGIIVVLEGVTVTAEGIGLTVPLIGMVTVVAPALRRVILPEIEPNDAEAAILK